MAAEAKPEGNNTQTGFYCENQGEPEIQRIGKLVEGVPAVIGWALQGNQTRSREY